MSSPPRRFSDLRPQPTVRQASEEESPGAVLRRVFVTSQDGIKALAILRAMVATPLPPLASNRALREAEGARSFLGNVEKLIQGQDAHSS